MAYLCVILARAWSDHRNLRTRTSKFALVQQTFLAKKNPCKKSADLHPIQGNLLQKEHFYRAQQNLSLQHKVGWRPAEKKFQHASSSTKISMGQAQITY
jgi:hypothetical protein